MNENKESRLPGGLIFLLIYSGWAFFYLRRLRNRLVSPGNKQSSLTYAVASITFIRTFM